jgi:hypothetical protein
MRSDRFLWRAFFTILLGLALALWLWIMFDDFV